jgi:hypothetical protein
MKRTPFLLVVLALWSALPLAAQSTEFGILVGGSRRFAEGGPQEEGTEFADGTFSFSNTSVDFFWSTAIEEDTRFKIKLGRIETIIPVAYELPGNDTTFRRDAEGEVQHIEGNIEYLFEEPYGKTGLFAGLGFYRQSPEGADAQDAWGFNAGVNVDFPLSRRYGVIGEATYHWVRDEFNPRYLTLSGGLRIGF